jgi:hypothetical protein
MPSTALALCLVSGPVFEEYTEMSLDYPANTDRMEARQEAIQEEIDYLMGLPLIALTDIAESASLTDDVEAIIFDTGSPGDTTDIEDLVYGMSTHSVLELVRECAGLTPFQGVLFTTKQEKVRGRFFRKYRAILSRMTREITEYATSRVDYRNEP